MGDDRRDALTHKIEEFRVIAKALSKGRGRRRPEPGRETD